MQLDLFRSLTQSLQQLYPFSAIDSDDETLLTNRASSFTPNSISG